MEVLCSVAAGWVLVATSAKDLYNVVAGISKLQAGLWDHWGQSSGMPCHRGTLPDWYCETVDCCSSDILTST